MSQTGRPQATPPAPQDITRAAPPRLLPSSPDNTPAAEFCKTRGFQCVELLTANVIPVVCQNVSISSKECLPYELPIASCGDCNDMFVHAYKACCFTSQVSSEWLPSLLV
jgi:hypothetical protein